MKKEKYLSFNTDSVTLSISSYGLATLFRTCQLMCLLISMSVVSVVHSAPLACDPVLYQSIDDKLMALDPLTGQYNQMGLTSASKYNAIGWDTRTNLIYGYRKQVFTLFSIDSTGQTTDLGAVSDGLGGTLEARTQAGDMDRNGNLWVHDRFVPMSLFKINVDTRTSEEVIFTGILVDSPNDLVHIEITNSLWGINKTSNTLVRFNLDTQVISSLPIANLPAVSGTGYGAAWTNSSNELIISNNNGGVYKIDDYLTAPSATFLIASAVTSKNDGASCPTAPRVFNPPPQNQPFSCTAADTEAYMFQIPDPGASMISEISTLNLATGIFISTGTQLSAHINGQGYNPKDNYIWGYNVSLDNGTISRIDKDGNIVNHKIAGLPAERYLAGDINNDGLLYLYRTGLTKFYIIDVNPSSVNYLSLVRSTDIVSIALGDMAFNPIDGQLYGITGFDNHSLVRINPLTGTQQNLGLTGIQFGGVVGAIYFDSDGFMYAYHNLDGKIFRLDISDPLNINPLATLFSEGHFVEFNDGARCNLVPLLIDFGDAPDTYGTTLASNGARHTFKTNSTLYLGSNLPDTETDAQITAFSGGDDTDNSDDEDAFTTLPQIDPTSTTYSLNVNCSGSGTVAGWIDFNRSGTFNSNERAAASCNANVAALNWTGLSGLVDGETYARFRIASNPSEVASPKGGANDGEVEDYPVTIGSSCIAFTGEVTEVALPLTAQLKTSERIFVPSKNSTTAGEGHLRAYSIESNGLASTTALWDAANLMNGRTSKLFSTDASGNKILFNALDNGAFSSGSVSTIKNNTIGANLGSISKGNSLDILTTSINTSRYLSDTTYRSYFTNTVSSRNQRVLMSSDDGFLYAFDYNSGELAWGWMPRSLVRELSSPTSFQSRHLMAGSVDILDLADSSGNYATYVVGSYKSGLGHYVLKLDGNGNISEIVWDDDQSASFIESPNNGEQEFFRDGSGKVYTTFALTNSALTSELVIKSLTDSSENLNIAIGYQISSTPFVMQDYGKSNAPIKKTLYIGTTLGAIHASVVLDVSNNLKSSAAIQAELESSKVTAMDDIDTDAVIYINASVSAKDNKYYLSSQTATQLTLHRYQSSNTTWNKAWTSSLSGGGSWDNNRVYVSDITIQGLPAGTTITDKAIIVGDAVMLPISIFDGSSASCYGDAFYYLYRLSNGKFPMNSIVTTDDAPITDNITLGFGEARRASITNLAGTNKLLAYGIADKKADLSSGIATTLVIKDLISGIRGWKEIGR